MLARGVVYLRAACPERSAFFAARVLHRSRRVHLPDPKSLAAKSSVSISSKLIEIKGLQLHYFGHLRKTGGEGELSAGTHQSHSAFCSSSTSFTSSTSFSSISSPLSLSSHSTARLLLYTFPERNLMVSPLFQGARPAGMSPLYRCPDAHD